MKQHRIIMATAASHWLTKMLLVVCTCQLAVATVTAQPKNRRTAATAAKPQTQPKATQNGLSQRAQLQFPTAVDMPEDVVWRRDIYREVDLNVDENAGLYYPILPKGKQMNLFTYIFKLAQNGYIPIYEYSPTESEERFEESAKRTFKDMLDDQGIYYEEKDGKISVDNSDIPSEEVRRYFLKESAYYDQNTSTFYRKVLALCPVRMSAFPTKSTEKDNASEDDEDDLSFGGDFGDEPPRPMFWINYSDLAPFLNRQTVMTSDKNNAAVMSMEDFFTLNRYKGSIYKTTNMLGRNLADYCKNDSALVKEQQRIEDELEAFRKGIFGTAQKAEQADSIALAADEKKTAKEAKKQRQSRTTAARQPKEKTEKVKTKTSGSPSSGAARVSVRRQRH